MQDSTPIFVALAPGFAPVDLAAHYVLECVKQENQALPEQLASFAELLDHDVDGAKYAVARTNG